MGKTPNLSFLGRTRELLCLSSYIKITDNSSALVENCRQIFECTEICVRLLTVLTLVRMQRAVWRSGGPSNKCGWSHAA